MAGFDEFISKNIKYLYIYRKGEKSIFDFTRRALKNFSKSLDQIYEFQNRSIPLVVDYAYEHSPFYRKKYRDAGFRPGDVKSIADLGKLPILSREDVCHHADELLCDNMKPGQYVKGSSGGTTGLPATFYRDIKCQIQRTSLDIALAKYYGWKDGQWQGWIWGATKDLLITDTFAGKFKKHWIDRLYILDITKLDTKNYQDFIDNTNRYKPTFISAYPSLVYDLALRIEAGEIGRARVPVVSVTAEPLYEFQRQVIEKYFADKCYQRYGAREIGTVAFECHEKKGMHIFPDNIYLESAPIDSSDKSLGTLLITDLVNRAMPLIRYRINDLGVIDENPCSCGLKLPRISNIQGRETDILWRSDGTGLAGIKVVTIVRLSEISAPIQVVQKELNKLIVRIEGSSEEHRVRLDKIVAGLKSELGPNVVVEIEQASKIERPASGKYRYVISQVQRPGAVAKK